MRAVSRSGWARRLSSSLLGFAPTPTLILPPLWFVKEEPNTYYVGRDCVMDMELEETYGELVCVMLRARLGQAQRNNNNHNNNIRNLHLIFCVAP